MELTELRDRAAAVLDEVERAIVGKRDALELILLALLCDGHVLLEDYPGLAKTLIARSLMVTGAAALLLAANPGLTVAQLKARLIAGSDQSSTLYSDSVSDGEIDIANAMEAPHGYVDIGQLNNAFLNEGASVDEYRAGIEKLKADGLVRIHEAGTRLYFTDKGAQQFA